MRTKHGVLILTQHPEQKGIAIINNDMTAGILCGMRCEDIIRAVNSHDALVEACKAGLKFIDSNFYTSPLPPDLYKLMEQAIDRAKENL